MAYVRVGPDTIERADKLRQYMIKGAIDFAAGRIAPEKFDEIHATFGFCYDSHQPASADHKQYITRRLRNFYPVSIRETADGFKVEYRHNRLPKRKRVTIPDGLLDDRLPCAIGLDDVSGKGWEVSVAEMRYRTLVGAGPHHLTVEWQTKENVWAT